MPESETDIIKKYKKEIEQHIDEDSIGEVPESEEFSQQYVKFKSEILSKTTSSYENWCNAFEKIASFQPGKKLKPDLEKAIETAHLNITPAGAASFAAIIGFLIILLGISISLIVFLLTNQILLFLLFIFLILGLIALFQLTKIPLIIAARWR